MGRLPKRKYVNRGAESGTAPRAFSRNVSCEVYVNLEAQFEEFNLFSSSTPANAEQDTVCNFSKE